MIINIILIAIAFIIAILELKDKKEETKTSGSKKILIVFLLITGLIFGIIKEAIDSNEDKQTESKQVLLNSKVDSLKAIINLQGDSINFLLTELVVNNYRLTKAIDTLSRQKRYIKSNYLEVKERRPVVSLAGGKFVKKELFGKPYYYEINFANYGKREAISLSGDITLFFRAEDKSLKLISQSKIPFTKNYVLPPMTGYNLKNAISFSEDKYVPMMYFHVRLEYADPLMKEKFSYEDTMKFYGMKNGDFVPDLSFVKDWEGKEILEVLKGKY